MQKTIDIIIPVYKGYLDTLNCLYSVLVSQINNQSKLNVIVINDASPDEKLANSLKKLAKSNRFTLLNNPQNLGFVQTVNLGMTITKNDVILLNSDTEVAGNWVDKLVAQAYKNCLNNAKTDIATVTPFSNNATICSYPLFCENNDIEKGTTVADLNYICEQVNPGKSIDIPTGVGFCLYITRASLDEVGLFDAESFGRGYGEENDFCLRAANLGYRNIFALDTFVKHSGGVSFADESIALQKQSAAVLATKHPNYQQKLEEYIANDPSEGIRFAMFLFELHKNHFEQLIFNYDDFQKTNLRKDDNAKIIHVSLANDKVVITNKLLLTNVVVDNPDDGDSNFDSCVNILNLLQIDRKILLKPAEECQQLITLFKQVKQSGNAVLHLINNSGGGTCRYVQDITSNDIINRHFVIYFNQTNQVFHDITHDEYFIFNLFDAAHKPDVAALLKILSRPVVDNIKFHLHSFYGDAFLLANAISDIMSGIATLHDHYFLTEKAFDQNRLEVDANKIEQVTQLILKLDIAIAPSKYIYQLATTYFPRANITLIEHGIDEPAEYLSQPTTELARDLMLDIKWDPRLPVIAIIGAISEQKGLFFLEKIKKQLSKYQVVLIGYTGMSLVPFSKKKFIQHGPYHQAELPTLLEYYGADLVLFLPGIAESYCYTLSDINGVVPVLAPDCGSFSNRVIDENLGKLYPITLSAKELKQEIITYMNSEPTIDASIRGIAAMIEETQKYYENVANGLWQEQVLNDKEIKEIIEENFNENNFKLALIHLAKDNYFLKKDVQALFATKKIGVIDELRIKAYPYKTRFLNLINMIKSKGLKPTVLVIYKRIKYFFAR